MQKPVPPSDPNADRKQRLITTIRRWTHYDNMVESLNQQAANARELRDKEEQEAIQLLKELGMSKTKLQISGATLQLSTRRNSAQLTWGYLEKEIPAWCASQRLTPTQAANLTEWLQTHREVKEMEFLRKSTPTPPKNTV
jgi:hypothetical protein